MKAILKLVKKQADDPGLWFIAQTAAEAYLQQELRKLHALIENTQTIKTGGSANVVGERDGA